MINPLTRELFDRRDAALDAVGDARGRLIRLINDGHDNLAAAIGDATHLHAYARWWITVTEHIEHHGVEAMTALTRTRTAARHILLDQVTPRSDCPFTYGLAIARLEATRHFYQDSGNVHGDNPQAGPTPPHPGSGPGPVYAAVTSRLPQ